MWFNSYSFAVFFAAVLAVHYSGIGWRARKTALLAASYLFYAAWNPPFVLLLWISTLTDWWAARRIDRSTGLHSRRAWLALSLGINLGMLAFFKYGGFLLDNLTAAGAWTGIGIAQGSPSDWSIVLPVGISFYTFQTLSYTLDVYRRRLKPDFSPLDFALYVTFFPQLVAGPIVRAHDFLPQCTEPRRATGPQFGWGLSLMILGLFEKNVLADGILAPVADVVFAPDAQPGFATGWTGVLAFSGQIFFDFAGYSTCAIGAALCLGFHLPDNFRAPYAADGFSDFWRRWHISLSTWLRDYLYIPLGGNRHGRLRCAANLMITMLLGGLWHGAAWTFVAWGALHGLFLALERLARASLRRSTFPNHPVIQLTRILATFLAVSFAWVFFRSESWNAALQLAGTLLGTSRQPSAQPVTILSTMETASVLGVIATLLAVHSILRHQTLESLVTRWPWWLRSLLLAAMIVLMATAPAEDRAFIYFQF